MSGIGNKVVTIASMISVTVFAQVPSALLKKRETKKEEEVVIIPKPIFLFDPEDQKKQPELVVRVPIKFKAKAQPLMIGKAAETPAPAPSASP